MAWTYLVALKNVKKRAQPRHSMKYDLCPVTSNPLENVVLATAPRSFPELAEGLEIGAMYDHSAENESSFCVERRYEAFYFLEWCRILTILVANRGKFIKRGSMDDWIAQVAGVLEDREKYPETDGRGPFWELVRYGLRGVTFGPVVCAKLVHDFDAWEHVAKTYGDEHFYDVYCKLRECFAYPNGSGLVYCPNADYFQHSESDDCPTLGIDLA